MATHAHQRFEGVDEVEVTVPFGTTSRKRKAKLIEKLRAAAQIRFLDGAEEERKVRYADLRPLTYKRGYGPASEALPPPVVQPPPPAQQPTLKAVPPPPAQQPAELKLKRILADVDEWLQMGRDLLAPIEAEIEAKAQQKAGLEAEKVAIDDELDCVTDELRELHAKRSEVVGRLKGRGA